VCVWGGGGAGADRNAGRNADGKQLQSNVIDDSPSALWKVHKALRTLSNNRG
jgi:hypothetical protein